MRFVSPVLSGKALKARTPSNMWSDDFAIISSTDHPYAIVDTMKKYLRETEESLDISAPWNSKSFVDMIRTFIPKPKVVRKRLITRTPNEEDLRIFRTIESFADLANSRVMCKPYLHAKFIIVDCRIVLWGSVNPTNAGMYDNDEILYISKKPMHLTRHKEIFDELWYDPRNTTWEKVQQYFGHKGHVTHKKMAEAILGFFDMNGNQEVFEKGLVERIARRLGVNTRDVSETIENLVIDSALYRPKPHTLKRT